MKDDPWPCFHVQNLETLQVIEFTWCFFYSLIHSFSFKKYVLSTYYVADIIRFSIPTSVDLSV